MKALLTDPVVLICSGIILFGIIGFVWAVGKFRSLGSVGSAAASDDAFVPAERDLPDLDFRAPSLSRPPTVSPVAPAAASPAVSRDVADRLESMTQRLAEMQTVLMKQSSGVASAAQGGAAAGVGQGFSPETIDKLLKIIGNVIQQVDILQKSLNMSKEAPAVKMESAASPFTRT